jgi:hypothetical protein
MSCIHNCGFILVWSLSEVIGDVGGIMDTHIAEVHTEIEFPMFFKFRKGKKNGEDLF